MRTQYWILALFAAVALPAAAAHATATIDVGTWNLDVDTVSGIQIVVQNGGAIEGMDLRAQIGEGTAGPIFVGVDYTGSIWDGQSFLSAVDPVDPGNNRWFNDGLALFAGTVTADGLLGTLLVDTTGLSVGQSFSLRLDEPFGGTALIIDANTNHALQLTNGTINIVPEPASLVLLGAGTLVLLRRRVACASSSRSG